VWKIASNTCNKLRSSRLKLITHPFHAYYRRRVRLAPFKPEIQLFGIMRIMSILY
jgi:hypothetical protein